MRIVVLGAMSIVMEWTRQAQRQRSCERLCLFQGSVLCFPKSTANEGRELVLEYGLNHALTCKASSERQRRSPKCASKKQGSQDKVLSRRINLIFSNGVMCPSQLSLAKLDSDCFTSAWKNSKHLSSELALSRTRHHNRRIM